MQEIRKFIQGFESFQSQYFCVEDSPFTELNKGQKPTTMVVACCDSRTNPTLVMGCEPGEIFVVRNIANIVPPYEPDQGHHGVSSAIEYAVKALGVRNIIILGHSSCGGIRALLENDPACQGEFIGHWLSVLKPVRDEVMERFSKVDTPACTACEMAAVIRSVKNLKTFPWVAEAVEAQNLALHGWYFDMTTGRLLSYLPETGGFEPLSQPCPSKEEQRAKTG